MKNKVFMAIILLGSWLSIMHGSAFDYVYKRRLKNINNLIEEIEKGDREEVRNLLNTVSVDFANENRSTPLLAAAKFGNVDILTDLINKASEQGVLSEYFLNHPDKDGKTALRIAIENGHREVVQKLKEESKRLKEDKKRLLENSSDLNLRDFMEIAQEEEQLAE